MTATQASRRGFLANAVAAPALAAAPAATRTLGANDRINIGMIGVGGKGRGHLRLLLGRARDQGDVQIAAISDIYDKRRNGALESAGLEAKHGFVDYRELLQRTDIDAVWIATPDHWHATMALDALAAGKDVYLEKPMTYTIEEARRIAEVVERTGRVLQVEGHALFSGVEEEVVGAALQVRSVPEEWLQAAEGVSAGGLDAHYLMPALHEEPSSIDR